MSCMKIKIGQNSLELKCILQVNVSESDLL